MNKSHPSLSVRLLATSLLLLCSCASFAEKADREKPIDIESDTVTVNDAKKTSIYSGNVILTQGTLEIRGDKLIVREDKDGFQQSTSTGMPSTFKQKMEGKDEYMQGNGQRIEYDGRMDVVKLYTQASVKRGDDVIHGDYIMYDANAEYAEVLGGGSQVATPSAPGGRVSVTIQPKKPAAAKPAVE